MEELTFKQPSTAERRFASLLVIAQVILLAVISALPRRTHWPVPRALRRAGYLGIAAGGCLAAVGAASLDRGLTASPLPNDRARLRTRGLYRWVRHPIYSGLLIGAAARAAISGNRWALVSFMALAGLLTGKARFGNGISPHDSPATQGTQLTPRGSFQDFDRAASTTSA